MFHFYKIHILKNNIYIKINIINMQFIKKFTKFKESVMTEEPVVKPDRTKTQPKTRPQRPTPFPTKRPSEHDLPSPKATQDDVIDKFIQLAIENEIDMKKYIKQ